MGVDRSAAGFRAMVALFVAGAAVLGAMVAFPNQAYLWVKAAHVIAVISWMAGMLYLPRLFIYHLDAPKGSAQSETFKLMERRLLRVIINPAMVISWVLGLWLVWKSGVWSSGWFWVKFVAVILMSATHGYFSASVRRFAADENTRTASHWRIMNEVPTVLMIIIVIMVIVRPL